MTLVVEGKEYPKGEYLYNVSDTERKDHYFLLNSRRRGMGGTAQHMGTSDEPVLDEPLDIAPGVKALFPFRAAGGRPIHIEGK